MTRLCIPYFNDGVYHPFLRTSSLSADKADGEPWDADGPPDPYAVLVIDGVTIGSTPAIPDTTSPAWSHLFPAVRIVRGASARIDVFDEDGVTDELVFSCTKLLDDIDGVEFADDFEFFYQCVPASSVADAGVSPDEVEFSLSLVR